MFGKNLMGKFASDNVPQEFSWIDMAMDAEAYRWLEENRPEYLVALEYAAAHGGDPVKLRQFIIRRGGQNRSEIAKRLEQALRHVRRMMELEGAEDEPDGAV